MERKKTFVSPFSSLCLLWLHLSYPSRESPKILAAGTQRIIKWRNSFIFISFAALSPFTTPCRQRRKSSFAISAIKVSSEEMFSHVIRNFMELTRDRQIGLVLWLFLGAKSFVKLLLDLC